MQTYTIIQGKHEVTKTFSNKKELRYWIIDHLLVDMPITILKIFNGDSIAKQCIS